MEVDYERQTKQTLSGQSDTFQTTDRQNENKSNHTQGYYNYHPEKKEYS